SRVLFSVSGVRGTPRCPGSPYTTLFRSRVARPERAVRVEVADVVGGVTRGRKALEAEDEIRRLVHLLPRHGCELTPARVEFVAVDRKSTRLNSSHLGISYAVFCLKKITQ